MKALTLPQPGANAQFEMLELEIPALPRGHILVRVAAAGLNPIDAKLRRRGGPLFPYHAILGADFAGTVSAVGEGVSTFKPGDEVYGCGGGVAGCTGGSLAEYIAVDASLVAPKPASISMHEAAALPLVALTAWEGLRRAGVRAGSEVLVRGGAGGVGHVAVQLAVAWDARVVATTRSEKNRSVIEALGASQVVEPQSIRPDSCDMAFDAAGIEGLDSLIGATRARGKIVLISGAGASDLGAAFQRALDIHFVFVVHPLVSGIGRNNMGDALREIARIVDAGQLQPRLAPRAFKLEDASDAFSSVESGNADGKVVIDIAA